MKHNLELLAHPTSQIQRIHLIKTGPTTKENVHQNNISIMDQHIYKGKLVNISISHLFNLSKRNINHVSKFPLIKTIPQKVNCSKNWKHTSMKMCPMIDASKISKLVSE
jgi:hypothetical protein